MNLYSIIDNYFQYHTLIFLYIISVGSGIVRGFGFVK